MVCFELGQNGVFVLVDGKRASEGWGRGSLQITHYSESLSSALLAQGTDTAKNSSGKRKEAIMNCLPDLQAE